jgi:hypothetical protein
MIARKMKLSLLYTTGAPAKWLKSAVAGVDDKGDYRTPRAPQPRDHRSAIRCWPPIARSGFAVATGAICCSRNHHAGGSAQEVGACTSSGPAPSGRPGRDLANGRGVLGSGRSITAVGRYRGNGGNRARGSRRPCNTFARGHLRAAAYPYESTRCKAIGCARSRRRGSVGRRSRPRCRVRRCRRSCCSRLLSGASSGY